MDYYGIKVKTRELYKNDSKQMLKFILFLTKLLKNIHTRKAIFLGTMIFPFGVALHIYIQSRVPQIFILAAILHIICYKLFLLQYKSGAKNDTLEDIYIEQECMQHTLEEMIKSKV